MEEGSEVHMDTGVSSTTDDVQEVPTSASTHRDVETVIVVESVKEEDMSPHKDKSASEPQTPDKSEQAQPLPLTPPQELTIKKIIIKSPFKDLQLRPIQRSPMKPGEAQKSMIKEAQPIKSSSPQKSEIPAVSSSKIDTQNSPKNDVEVTVQSTIVNSSDTQKSVQKLPVKDSRLQETESKELQTKPSPSKEQNLIAKEQPPKSVVLQEQPLKSVVLQKQPNEPPPIQEQSDKSTTPTVGSVNTSVIKDSTAKATPVKETSIKIITIKPSPVKELSIKPNVTKKAPSELALTKEQTGKTYLSKESPPKTPTAESTPSKKVQNESKPEQPQIKNKNLSHIEDKEASNDSQTETNSDTSEKEHKSISRELRSLINSAKESKIISECTQLTSKTRKSRTPLDTSLTTSTEPDKIQGVRRHSDNSQKSSSSERSDKTAVKRSMRSQNPEFVSKVKHFLSSVSGKKVEGDADDESEKGSTANLPKKKKKEEGVEDNDKSFTEKSTSLPNTLDQTNNKLRSDQYCWRCHWSVEPVGDEKMPPRTYCSVCPRTFHYKCLSSQERTKTHMEKNWVCPECMGILQAESSDTRSPAMKKISLGMLCDLLKYALERMMEVNGVEPFTQPVDRTIFPDYDKYVVHPMDLGLMKKNINEGLYGSTEAFLADAQWILHNSIIFNTLQAKLTAGARALVRSCRAEMGEIEACPECYAAAHARKPTWFTDVCSTPHILLWAKLKGFPYWPAKGMSMNSSGLVDVRFFGAHDRAWVPARDCFLFSEKDPNNFRTKRQDILDSTQEAEQHIRNITRKYGKFVYPPFKTQFDPSKLYEQIKMMIPSFEGEVRSSTKVNKAISSPSSVKENRRSNSKSSKSSINDGDMSENEESTVTSRKMADGAVIAREEDDFSVDKDKDKNMDVDTAQNKDSDTSRKRRRSDLEEAVFTIIDTTKEKRKRVGSVEKKDTKDPAEKNEHKNEKVEAKEPEKCKQDTTKIPTTAKENAPSTSTGDTKSTKVTPVKIISIAKVMRNGKPSPKVTLIKSKEEDNTPKQKPKSDKPIAEKDKGTPEEEDKKEERKARRRNSNKIKSLNSSNAGKIDKAPEKKTETSSKDKSKDSNANKAKEPEGNKSNHTEKSKSTKDRIQFDDDTSLAVLARQSKNNTTNTGLPTITSVRSLSTAQAQGTTSGAKSIEITVETPINSSIFTPTSTENVRTMKEAANKLQKLRGEKEAPAPSQVGRVGVRAFARIQSPPEKETRPNNDMHVEIKTEPMEYEESERQMQDKMDLMNAFKLRPVNPSTSNLREVRINKVVVTPLSRKGATGSQQKGPQHPAPQQTGMRAKKTFPQPKKPEEGRSELTCKNSMVYIPIQPPMTQAPVRGLRPIAAGPPATPPQPRAITPMNNTSNGVRTLQGIAAKLVKQQISRLEDKLPKANNIVNTVTTPLVSFSSPSTSTASSTNSTPLQAIPTVGQVPSTVHTMPLITSVNGQWTFSLQPVLSVGGVDGTSSPPMVNGLADRTGLVPIAPAGQVIIPAPPPSLAIPAGSTNTTQPTKPTSETNNPGEPPRLLQRPALVNPLDASAPVGNIPAPSSVGPLTAKLNQNAVKMTDFFRTLLEDSIDRLEDPSAHLTATRLHLEQAQWRHQQAMDELKHNHELTVAEMRSSFEKEKVRLIAETRRQSQMELDAAVKLAKSKQWCANCNQEAQFYCCWNTSYCDYPCQRAHWATHYAVCTQQRQDNSGNNDSANPSESRLQQAPENLPKTTAAPNLTAGKLQPSRVYTQEQTPTQKTSIIVSMVEDNAGNQTMKCVGTYKSPNTSTSISPLILNKQLLSNEEATKKVVTSGGYLIVGASNSTSNSTTITQARRATAIQYIS